MRILEFYHPMKLISKDNEKFVNKRGIPFLSKRFKDFEKLIKQQVQKQYQGEMLNGRLQMTIIALFQTKVHCDASNLAKSLNDAYQGQVYLNDRQIKDVRVLVVESKKLKTDCFYTIVKEKDDAQMEH